MANIYLDFHNKSSFTPYIMGGYGLLFTELTTTMESNDIKNAPNKATSSYGSATSSKNNLAWSAGAGVAYNFYTDWIADLSFNYIDAGKETLTFVSQPSGNAIYTETVKLNSIDAMLGIRYTF